MLGLMMGLMIAGCGDDGIDDPDDGIVKVWPQELTPNTVTSGTTRRNGRYTEDVNMTRPMIIFDGDKTFIYWSPDDKSVHCNLISIKDKKIEVKVDSVSEALESFYEYGQNLILCDSYTLENGVLTLTGGNFTSTLPGPGDLPGPGVSNKTWYLRN